MRILSILSLPSGFLPSDTAICSYGDMLLKPVQSFARYTWSNGSAGPSLVINQPGTFWLEVEDNKQCRGRDSVLVQQKDCLQGFLIPTAFSPNGDGKNDDFKPLIFGRIEQYSFSVYNRWGQVVFHSNTPGQAWSGNHGSRSQDTSIFVWVCHYKLQNENQKTARGTVLLVR